MHMTEHPPFRGTEFQVKVWNAIKEIPRGEIRTYAEIAVQIGHPNSARAVANACGQNPYPPIVPCHRVVRSDGGLGGYSGVGGVETKRRLLSEEGFRKPLALKMSAWVTFLYPSKQRGPLYEHVIYSIINE